MESVIDALKRRLREAGPCRWFAIAAEAGVAKTLPRKLVYGDRCNPGIRTIQPLISFFAEVDGGMRALPNPSDGLQGPAQLEMLGPAPTEASHPPCS